MWTIEKTLWRIRTKFNETIARQNRTINQWFEWKMDEEIEVWGRFLRCWWFDSNDSRFDCEKIRKDLLQQKDDEKQRIIDELQKQKQNHVTSAQSQIQELEEQVTKKTNFIEEIRWNDGRI